MKHFGHRTASAAGIAFLGASLMSLGGCVTTTYGGQAGALAAAATAFKSELEARPAVLAADETLGRTILLTRLGEGGPASLYAGCDSEAYGWQLSVLAASTPEEETRAYQKLRQVRACGAGASHPSAAASDLAAQKTLELIVAYFEGVQGVVGAASGQGVADACSKLGGSLGALAATLHAPAPAAAAPGFVAKLASMALEQAKAAALRRAVLDVDPMFDKARPALVRALRIRRSLEALEVADDASIGVRAINGALDGARDPTTKLRLYDGFAPLLADFAQEQAAVQGDPATTVDALITAHHALAKTLRSKGLQAQEIVADVTAIADAAAPLAPVAAAPPAARKG